MNPNIKPSDCAILAAVVDPQSATTAKSTGWVNMGLHGKIVATVFAGAFATGAKLNAKLEQATSDGGTPKDITGKAITELTEAGTDDNKQVVINCFGEELDVANGYDWVRLTITPSVDAVLIAGSIHAMNPRYAPADVSTVDEVVG